MLDEILFIPAGEPWRKSNRSITDATHRLAMLQLAIEGNDAFGLSDIEVRRDGPTYTADTLAALAGERVYDAFWFIVGADALADLPNWHEPERIIRHAMLAVAPRDAQDDLPRVEVVADGHGIVPLRRPVERQVLQHHDRVARRDLAQQVFQLRRERIGDQPVATRGREHLGLQRALARGQVDLRQRFRRRRAARAVGLVFGSDPAMRAARLDPVEALRYE